MKSFSNIMITGLLMVPLSLFSQTDKHMKPSDILPSIPLYINQNYPDHGKVVYYSETINDTVYCEAIFKW
ncbi:MAG: hypothetical protein K2Q22_09280, partial [Cytophagales bacterium]|nr:hypothetical protein [Cytophagales bacterium]